MQTKPPVQTKSNHYPTLKCSNLIRQQTIRLLNVSPSETGVRDPLRPLGPSPHPLSVMPSLHFTVLVCSSNQNVYLMSLANTLIEFEYMLNRTEQKPGEWCFSIRMPNEMHRNTTQLVVEFSSVTLIYLPTTYEQRGDGFFYYEINITILSNKLCNKK